MLLVKSTYICQKFYLMPNAVLHLTNATIFQKENLILDDVTISIEKGEFVLVNK